MFDAKWVKREKGSESVDELASKGARLEGKEGEGERSASFREYVFTSIKTRRAWDDGELREASSNLRARERVVNKGQAERGQRARGWERGVERDRPTEKWARRERKREQKAKRSQL